MVSPDAGSLRAAVDEVAQRARAHGVTAARSDISKMQLRRSSSGKRSAGSTQRSGGSAPRAVIARAPAGGRRRRPARRSRRPRPRGPTPASAGSRPLTRTVRSPASPRRRARRRSAPRAERASRAARLGSAPEAPDAASRRRSSRRGRSDSRKSHARQPKDVGEREQLGVQRVDGLGLADRVGEAHRPARRCSGSTSTGSSLPHHHRAPSSPRRAASAARRARSAPRRGAPGSRPAAITRTSSGRSSPSALDGRPRPSRSSCPGWSPSPARPAARRPAKRSSSSSCRAGHPVQAAEVEVVAARPRGRPAIAATLTR